MRVDYGFVGPAGNCVFYPPDLRPYICLRGENVSGFMMYGPYCHCPAGRHEGSFFFRVEEDKKPQGTIIIDVAVNGGEVVVASRKLTTADLRRSCSQTLPFSLEKETDLLELRVFADRAAGVSVCREVTITGDAAYVPDPLLPTKYAMAMSQREQMEIPPTPVSYRLQVHIDYPGVLVPPPHNYRFAEVEKLLHRDKPAIMEYVERVSPFAFGGKIEEIPEQETSPREPYWLNGMFPAGDARAYYGMIAALSPKRVVEIGSGFSTKFARRAITDQNLTTNLIAIDPYPRSEIAEVVDEYIPVSVQNMDFSFFDCLESGDFLFIDSSHMVLYGADTTHIYLDILPRLRQGVHIHIHDIMLPWDYVRGYAAQYYAEQYLVAALLLGGDRYSVVLPSRWLMQTVHERWNGASFWIRKNF